MKKQLGSYQNHPQKKREFNHYSSSFILWWASVSVHVGEFAGEFELALIHDVVRTLGKSNLFRFSSRLFIFDLVYWESFDILVRNSFGYWYFLEFYFYFTQVVLQFFYGLFIYMERVLFGIIVTGV